MLSFDITDKNIRIVKGTESGGKIKISAATEIELDESLIVNGHINEFNRVIAIISSGMNKAGIADKEAIVSISSNQTIFKELMIPPNPKEAEFMKSIRMELQKQINIDDSYSVGYIIVGEPETDEDGNQLQKILATACPRDVIDSYKKIFNMMQISLKSVMIGCNAITKVLLADAKNQAKMPLLAVQIDANFISLNLYEDNTLSFSRFASIDPEDYDNPDDYVFEAVNENIFRMLQFARIRGSEEIKNVVFYGDLEASPNLYKRLQDDLAHNELEVSQLTIPTQIHGSNNLNFAIYANAIGAMFRRDKLTERINLLETDLIGSGLGGAVAGKVQDDRSFNIVAIAGLGLAVVIVGVAFGILSVFDGNYKKQTSDLRAVIDSPETAAKLQQYDDLQAMKEVVRVYAENINNARDAYNTKPIIREAVYTAIDDSIKAVMEETQGVSGDPTYSVNYADGVLTVPVMMFSTEETTQKYPSNLVQYFYDNYGAEAEEEENRMFAVVSYSGYSVSAGTSDSGQEGSNITFDLTLEMLPNELPAMEEEAPAEEAPADEAPADEAPAEQ